MPTTTKKRTSVGSGKTRGAVSLANIRVKELLSFIGEESEIPIGRVFAESLGFKLRQKKGGKPQMVLA